VNKVPILLVNA